MGMLQPLQLPEKSGVTTRFADLFAARTREILPDGGTGLEDSSGVFGGVSGAAAQPAFPSVGLMPLALPRMDTAQLAPGATDPMALATVVNAGTPDLMPRHTVIAGEAGKSAAAAGTVELPSELTRAAVGIDSDIATPLPAVDARKLTDHLSGSDTARRTVPGASTALPAADAADTKPAPPSSAPVSLAETLAEDGERQAANPRVVSGVEVATLASLSPRAPGLPAADLRATAPRTVQTAVNTAAAAASVDEGAADLPPVFDQAGGLDDVPGPLGLVPTTAVRNQPAAPLSVIAPDLSSAVTTVVELAARNTTSVEDVNALDQLDAPSEMAELSIDTPVDDPNWSEALNYRLQWLAQKGGAQSARIQLNPVELGPMEVHVEVVDEVATVQIRADHGLTREALEQAAPRLRELMSGAGIEHAEFEVTGGEGDDARRAGAGLANGQSDTRDEARSEAMSADSATQSSDGERGANNHLTAGLDTDNNGGLNLYV